MGSAVETLCGQAYGAHKYDMLGVYLQRSTILLMATGVPLAIIYAFSRPLLVFLGESQEIAKAASIFVFGLIPQIFAYAANFPIQKFLQVSKFFFYAKVISIKICTTLFKICILCRHKVSLHPVLTSQLLPLWSTSC